MSPAVRDPDARAAGADLNPALVEELGPELTADLLRMRDLLEAHDVDAARAWIGELEAKWPDSERVRHYARVLAPPVARVVEGCTARDLGPEREWLRARGHEYPGCWLAIYGDRLLAASPDLKAVREAARRELGEERYLLFYQASPYVP